MAWLRLSLVNPFPASRQEVLRLLNDLENHLTGEAGFVTGGVFVSEDPAGQLGRFTIWESRDDGDRASANQHVMSVESQIHTMIEPGHLENFFEITNGPLQPRKG